MEIFVKRCCRPGIKRNLKENHLLFTLAALYSEEHILDTTALIHKNALLQCCAYRRCQAKQDEDHHNQLGRSRN